MLDALHPAALHVVSRIHWEREGRETFEVQRAWLLDTLARLAGRMADDQKLYVLLGGQTAILEDVAAVRPDLVALLSIYNATGRLGIGPWYVQVDEALVSGESLIRNLLAGRADAQKHGLNLLNIGYIPDVYGHVGQLPQILRGFGMDAAFLCHGAPVTHLPFRWEGPDGSALLVVNHDHLVGDLTSAKKSLEEQEAADPSAPMLWIEDALVNRSNELENVTGIAVNLSSLPAYVRALRDSLPDEERPSVVGELRLQGLRENAYILPGTLSARLYLKQAHNHLENQLLYAAEPWLALALTHGKVEFPDNLRALLNHSWRLLLKNQSRSALGGGGSDAVHEENEIRSRQIEDASRQVIRGALQSLPGTPGFSGHDDPYSDKTYVVVWNPHNWEIDQVVEAALRVPAGMQPVDMRDPDGLEVVYNWQSNGDDSGLLSFRTRVPAVGYAAYLVTLVRGQETVYTVRASGNAVSASPDPVTLVVEDGRLVTKIVQPPVYDDEGVLVQEGTEYDLIGDLLRFFDGGDAGDATTYCPPHTDAVLQADMLADVYTESSPLYQRLILHHRLRLSPSLRPDRSRGRGVKPIEITTTATLYDYMPGVYFHTTFDNDVLDHRLRAHLRTGIRSSEVLSDSAFGVVTRSIHMEGAAYPTRPNLEGVVNTYPMRSMCAVQDDSSGMALLARGLPEFEAIPEDGQTTLALTLLRAVGWLNRPDLKTRTGTLGSMLAVPGAQCQRPISAEYALIPIWPNDPSVLRIAREYSAPLQAYQYRTPPPHTRFTYLNVEGEGVLMTALKPPQTGKGWMVRLLNPTDSAIDAKLTPLGPLTRAQVVNLAEETVDDLDIHDGAVWVSLYPHQIVTLRLAF